MCVHMCVRACVCACIHACVHAYVCACVCCVTDLFSFFVVVIGMAPKLADMMKNHSTGKKAGQQFVM